MKKVILSVDGGGVFGAAPASLLSRMDHSLLRFDAYAGTSIGSAISAALSVGVSPEKILDMFEGRMGTVFPQAWYRRFLVLSAKYPDSGLNQVIKDLVGEKTLFGDASAPLFIVAGDLATNSVKIFSSVKDEDKGLPMWEVVRASVAAPTYFPPWKNYCDGGIFANNPGMVAVAGCIRSLGFDDDEIHMLSLGCGEDLLSKQKRLDRSSSVLQWAPKLLRMMLDGGANKMHDFFVSSVLGDRVLRLQYNRNPDWAFDDPSNVEFCLSAWHDALEGGALSANSFLRGISRA